MKTSTNRKHRGISSVWFVLTFIILVAILGLMLDWAHVYLVAQQLHTTADAAALAGSRYVAWDPNTATRITARQKAQEYANNNTAAKLPVDLAYAPGDVSTVTDIDFMTLTPTAVWALISDSDVHTGRYITNSRLFIKNDPYPDAMLVATRKVTGRANVPLPLLFAPIVTRFFNGTIISDAGIQKYAIAKIGNPYGAGVLALGECPGCPGIIFGSSDPDDPAITIFGGGSLYVNSSYTPGGNDGAVDQSGNANVVVDLDSMYVVGGVDQNFNYPDDTDVQDYNDNVTPEPDPYADLPDASYSTTPDLGTISASGTYSPGYYSGGIQVGTAGTSVNLLPGDYYLDSVGQADSLRMTSGLITGENVTLHIVGDADSAIYINGGNMDISAPTSGDYAGVAIFDKRDPTYDCAQSCASPWSKAVPISVFSGNGDILIEGAVYMPHTRLELGGTGEITMTRTVADRLYIYGSSQKVVNYKGVPKIAEKSYLVE